MPGRFAGKLIVDWSLPGKLAWCIMEIVSPVVFGLSMWTTQHWEARQMLLSGLWFSHYANRAVLHPLRATSMAPIHVLTFVSSVVFNVLNGYTNGMWTAHHAESSASWLTTATGLGLWAAGLFANVYHDNLLFRLRRDRKPDQPRYVIPHGGLFEYVSCPNYFGEAIEWVGYYLVAYPSRPALVFALATMANLFPRAWRTHAWYRRQFPDYPSSRKAVIPFVF